jgi:hypothetical protein
MSNKRWAGEPKSLSEAKRAICGRTCLVCGSALLVTFIRPPIPNWRVHCNNCATEVNVSVMLNLKEWKV